MNYLMVFIGAGAGGALRFYISSVLQKSIPYIFPFGTLAVNLLGSFILGILIFWFDEKELLSINFKMLLAVGFCGGLTTFSTFSFETISLLRDAQFLLASANVLLNVVISISAIYIAFIITR